MIKKIAINILLIIIIFIIAEFSCAVFETAIIVKENKNEKQTFVQALKDSGTFITYSYSKKREFETRYESIRSPKVVKNSTKKPILIGGCSFANGYLLKENECLHYFLSKETNRTVSNIGIGSGSPREFLWFLRNEKDLNEHIAANKNVEYVIYVYIADQKRRLYYDLDIAAPQYKINKDFTEIELSPDKWYYHLFLYKEYKLLKYLFTSAENKNKLQKLFFDTIAKESKELFPNSQFIVLDYANESAPEIQDLEKDGIKVITLGKELNVDLHQKQFKASDNNHPNAKVWDMTAKMLKEKLDL